MLQRVRERQRHRKIRRTHPSPGLPVRRRSRSHTRTVPAVRQQKFDFSHRSTPGPTVSPREWITQLSRGTPAAIASAMIGLSIAMVIAGLTGYLDALFVQRGQTTGSIVCGALMALTVGVVVPQRFAMWICTAAWRRFLLRGQSSDISAILIHPDAADRPLYWMVLSVIALIGGVATAFLPITLHFTALMYHQLHVHFVWSSIPLEISHVSVSFFSALIPLYFLGIAISCVHHLSCPFGRWETSATGWLLVGAAAGILIHGFLSDQGLASTMVLIASSLPALLVALISTGVSSSRKLQRVRYGEPVEDAASWLPMWSDRWPRLLRAGIVAVGGGSACGVAVWARPLRGDLSCNLLLSAMILALGFGVLIACGTRRAGFRSIGGFGVACASAGVVVAGATAMVNNLRPTGFFSYILPACAALLAIGYATAYGRKTLLTRVAGKSTAGTRITAGLLLCAALTVWVGAPVMLMLVGIVATLVMLALSLLAMGGLLIIHEPTYSSRTRRVRLLAVFGCIAAMILMAALPSNPWRPRFKPQTTTLKSPGSYDSDETR